MKEKSTINTILVLAVLCAGIILAYGNSVYAAAITWDGSESSSWSNPDNWVGGVVPTSHLDEAVINSSTVPNYLHITAGDVVGTGRLTVRISGICSMDGGSLSMYNAAGRWRIGWRTGDNCFMTVNGGTINTVYTLQICEDKGANGYLSVSNATVSIGRGIICGAVTGAGTGGGATMIIEPGTTFSCATLGYFPTEIRPNGKMTINGGLLNCNSLLNVFTGGVLRVNNGTVQATDLTIQGSGINGLVDVSKGTIEISSNVVATMQQYVTDGKLTGYAGAGSVVINYDGGTETTTVTAIPEPVAAGLLLIGVTGMALYRRSRKG